MESDAKQTEEFRLNGNARKGEVHAWVLTVAREIRKIRPQNGHKMIAITAFALEGDRGKCLEAGMDDYISKPAEKKKLEAVLMRYENPL